MSQAIKRRTLTILKEPRAKKQKHIHDNIPNLFPSTTNVLQKAEASILELEQEQMDRYAKIRVLQEEYNRKNKLLTEQYKKQETIKYGKDLADALNKLSLDNWKCICDWLGMVETHTTLCLVSKKFNETFSQIPWSSLTVKMRNVSTHNRNHFWNRIAKNTGLERLHLVFQKLYTVPDQLPILTFSIPCVMLDSVEEGYDINDIKIYDIMCRFPHVKMIIIMNVLPREKVKQLVKRYSCNDKGLVICVDSKHDDGWIRRYYAYGPFLEKNHSLRRLLSTIEDENVRTELFDSVGVRELK
jgi:hypothetical protein